MVATEQGFAMKVRPEGVQKLRGEVHSSSGYALPKAIHVLNLARKADLFREFERRREVTYQAAVRVLALFQQQKLSRFDIFRAAGFRGREENFSNALAALLDPRQSHGLGLFPLRSMLSVLHHRDFDSISTVLDVISDSQTRVEVVREMHLGSTVVDIAILSDRFTIFIENKVRGGCETWGGGIQQTTRLWEQLKERRLKKSAQKDHPILGIYLSPEGKCPANKHFIPLSVSELISALRQAIAMSEGSPFDQSILAFLDFYDWSNC